MGVLLPVYLASIDTSIFVGLFFSLSAASTLAVVGVLSLFGHRVNVRNVLIVQTLLLAASLAIMALSPFTSLFLLASAISVTNWAPGGGSGSGGGAYNTAVTILLSQQTGSDARTLALSLSSVIGALSFSAGALLLSFAAVPLSRMVISPVSTSNLSLSSPSSLFAFSAVFQLSAAIILLGVKGDRPQPSVQSPSPAAGAVRSLGRVVRQAYLFVIAEFLNGLGSALFTPLVPLWFYVRFGISLTTVGAIFASVGVIAALMVLLSPKLESVFGSTSSIFLARGVSAVLLLFTAFAPTLVLALAPYLLYVIMVRLAVPIQQSFVFSKVGRAEWTRAANQVATANGVGATIGPLIGAFLLLDVNPALPFLFAFPLILASALIYKRSQFAKTGEDDIGPQK